MADHCTIENKANDQGRGKYSAVINSDYGLATERFVPVHEITSKNELKPAHYSQGATKE